MKLIKANHQWQWIILLLVAGTGLSFWLGAKDPQDNSSQAVQIQAKPVETARIQAGSASQMVKLLGQVEAGESAILRSQLEGTVQQVLVRVGDRVEQGQVLALLDQSDQQLALLEAQARLAQARAQLTRLEIGTRSETIAARQAELNSAKARTIEAKDNLERIKSLVEEGALSQRELVQAQTEADAIFNEQLRLEAILAEAEAGPTLEEIQAQRQVVEALEIAVAKAELDLDRATIKADFGGVVQTREINLGDYVESGDPLMTLVNNEQLDIFLEVPESLIGQITPGLTINLTARAIPDWQQQGEITGVVLGTESATRRQLVRVNLAEPTSQLLPGMAVQGDLELSIPTDSPVFLVNRDALTRRGEQWLIFAVEAEQVKQYSVELIADLGETVAITNPELQPDQEVVVSGGEGLQDGAQVEIINRGS